MEGDRTVCPMSHGKYILASSLGALFRERPEDDCSQPIQEDVGLLTDSFQNHPQELIRTSLQLCSIRTAGA
jgi:hypothetical protein